ncbi:MAG: class II aldolase, partial [Alphaproteobacteria bacterium]
GETLAEAARRARGGNPPRPLLIVPGRGAALPADAAPAAAEMACAFGEVLLRAGPGAALVRLDPAEEAALLGWDAEKHRQALEARRAGRE